MQINRKAKRARELEHQLLHSEVMALRCALDALYDRFDTITDPVQMDACIYEMNAVMARYDYTIKCLKAFDVS